MSGNDKETMGGQRTVNRGEAPGAGGREEWTGTLSGGVTDDREGGVPVLAGRYRVVKRLGEGGMGSVWLAEDLKLDGKRFAIKMLPAVLAGKREKCRQVKTEALMAMKLAHPNIATVRAFEEDEGGNPFLVMDYIEGTGLDDILAEKGKLTEEEALKVLGPVAAALDYAHSKGVVHRDVKPGNVMVDKNGTPFVLDFGIAREIQETMTRVTGKFSSGTLLYMSPEQLNGRAPKAAQDVYSFAAMAYECLTGMPPFSRGQIEWQIVNNPPEPLEEGVAGEALRAGILAGLAKKPEERPGTCAGVLGRDEAARRAREALAAEEARRRQEEAERQVREERQRREAEEKRRAEEEARRAQVEAERRQKEAELEAERQARRMAEAQAREARRRAQIEEAAAKRAEEERAHTRAWVWVLGALLVMGAWAGWGMWSQEQEGHRKEQKKNEQKINELTQATEDWKRKAQATPVAAAPAAPAKPATPPAQPAAPPAKPAAEPAKAARAEGEGAYEGAVTNLPLAGMKMHWCPKGTFTMGSPVGEDGRYDDEVQHEVKLTRGFWMAETEVTQGQWKELMETTVKDLARKGLQDDTEYDLEGKKQTLRAFWGLERHSDPMNRCGDLDDEVPVYNVSWGEAKEFCKRLTQKGRSAGWLPAGYSFRLPTEAEWEYACRAGTTTALPNGKNIQIKGKNNAPALDDIAWYGGNSSVGFEGRGWNTESWPEKEYPGGLACARKVGMKAENGWGLRDMIGNVWEWCEDEYAGYPIASSLTDYCKRNSSTAPGVPRVLRGGSWGDRARGCRSADRGWGPAGCRSIYVGFRPVCSAGTVQ